MLGLRCCEGISLLVSRGCSLVPGLGLLIVAAPLEEHSSGFSGFSRCGFWVLEHSGCGAQVPLFHGTWDDSRIRDKLESPASAGGFFTIELPQKHCLYICMYIFLPHQGACGILVPRPEIEPVPIAVESQSANRHTARKAPLGQVLISLRCSFFIWKM